MARLLVGEEWYQQLSSASLYEIEYQRLLLDRAEVLFPGYFLTRFDPLIQSDHDGRKPDLALVDRKLRSWWVVEVEMAHHSLAGHVVPQVTTLVNGRYGLAEAERLSEGIPSLALDDALDLLKGEQPRVLVIANERRLGWEEELRRVSAMLMVVEVFRSDRNRYSLRVNGEYPVLPEDLLTNCRPDVVLPGLLIVDSPAMLPSTSAATLSIEVAGELTEWLRVDVQDRVWLKPHGANPVEGQKGPFALIQTTDGRLALE